VFGKVSATWVFLQALFKHTQLHQSMRIGFDAKRAFHNHTGLGNYSRFIINALLEHAPENDYLAYTPKKGNGSWQPQHLAVKLPQKTFSKSLWRSYFINQQLIHDQVQIYHGLSNELPWGIHKTSVKSVVTIHDLIFLRYPELYPAIDRWIYQKKFKQACLQANLVVAISEQTKKDIIDLLGINEHKIVVVYQDCDEAFSRLLPSSYIDTVLQKYQLRKKYILCVATMTERKNQLTLLKAFQAMQSPDYELVLVGGKGKYQDTLTHYIATHKLKGVHIFNKVPFADLPSLYQGASLTVYPSFFEGFGIPIVESLHSGIPVIAATGSCLEEAGGPNGIYVNPQDFMGFAEKITQILTNPTLAKQLVTAGQSHIQQFSSASIAKKLNYYYQNLSN
jgi:glycosyltransferase involved in cell wall biosynthesis